MKALIAALALATLIAVPMFAQPANAPPVPPASSSFGSNGYFAPATAAPQVMAPVSEDDLSSAPPCRLIIASYVP